MISSPQNPQFKKLKKLTLKKYRDLYKEFLVFGNHLIQEAFKKNIVTELYSVSTSEKGILIKESLMKDLNQNKVLYPQVALCKMIQKPLKSDKILILENIQDPSNAGVLLRSACAFGFQHVFFNNKSVDFYNEKTIQVSQGACFNLFLERGYVEKFLISVKKDNYNIFSACVYEKNIDLDELPISFLKQKRVLIVGNEGKGISPSIKKMSDYYLNIDTCVVESLNVGVAGSILMYILK